ncbi:hypothetical protein GCM10010168_80490 [Actinoplanes ianthinogenes]|uniref:HTH hxlR-type domain-containing protein n=1 Tax=Actinoplanes ianthinogenes TaxID=122358 RepID=A0ABM7M1S4_9ACTN|nr:hypothetical protein Aiant_61700 [Actinoplanes ianthinogenes]GGR49546.1 hypothetical protein GCM10010168_80490 [Actinoplanes ianthinogenes]
MLLEALSGGERRFGQLRAAADGISEKMLTQTLRSLERDGLVAREVLPGTPPGVAYRLTGLGSSLLEPLMAIRDWGQRHMTEVEEARTAFDGR